MGSYLAHGFEIYPKAHENPRTFSCISDSIFLESSIQCLWGLQLHHLTKLHDLVFEPSDERRYTH
ncbi:hypothetical protein HKD37_17G048556 [Glycine soja]